MKKFLIAALALVVALPLSANAERLAAPAAATSALSAKVAAPASSDNEDCPMKGDKSININFNSVETDMSGIDKVMDKKINAVKALATEAGASSINIQSMNYSVSVNSSGAPYNEDGADKTFQFYGSANFKVQPAEKTADVMAKIAAKGYNASMSANEYRQCN